MSQPMHPWEPPKAGSELSHVMGTLERLRATFAWKVEGLDQSGLTFRLATTNVTLGGLLKHLARAEDQMFTRKLFGEPTSSPWSSAPWNENPDWDFNSASHDSPASLYQLWMDTVVRSRRACERALREGGLDHVVFLSWNDEHVSLRRLLFDLIEECGRHTGHADLLREGFDCRTLEDPSEDFSWSIPFDTSH